MVKKPPASAGDERNSSSIPGDGEDPLEEGMATYSSVLAWEIPWTQKPERLHLNTHTHNGTKSSGNSIL